MMQPKPDEVTCRTVIRNGRYWWIYSDGRERPAICGGADGSDGDANASGKDDDGDDENDDDLDDDVKNDEDDDDEDDDGKGDKGKDDKSNPEAEKWKALARKHEREVKRLRRERMNDTEKAIEDAREEGRKAALAELGGRLVEAEVRAVAAGRMKPDALRTLLDGLNVERFLDGDGEVDRKAIRRFVNGIIGSVQSASTDDDEGDDEVPTPKLRKRPDTGQGRRLGKTKPSVAAGRDLYAERHPRKDK